jgi:hypothetical protein
MKVKDRKMALVKAFARKPGQRLWLPPKGKKK